MLKSTPRNPVDVGWRRGHRWAVGAVVVIALLVAFGTLVPSHAQGEYVGGRYEVTWLPDVSVRNSACPPLAMPRDARGEPFAAVHPKDPEVIVVGTIGRTNSSDAQAALGSSPEPSQP